MAAARQISISDIKSTHDRRQVTDSVCAFLRSCSSRVSLRHYDADREKEFARIAKKAGVPALFGMCANADHKRWAASGIESLTRKDDQYMFHSKYIQEMIRSYPELGRSFGGKVLDIGCSVGWLSELLRERFGSDPTGADIDEHALALGRFFGARNLVRIPKNPYALPFATGAFNSVVSCAVLFDSNDYRCENEDRVLGEISRVMAQDGVLVAFISALNSFQAGCMKRTLARHGLSPFALAKDWSAWKKIQSRQG